MTVTAPPRSAAAPPPPARPVRAAAGSPGSLLVWWRRLTAMRTAIVLLFLLALAAVPGSLLPQRSLSQNNVTQYFAEHPDLAPVLDRLYLFDVFSSPWFAAVYLLLFVSLIGCVLPRAMEHLRAMRAAPPPAPRNLLRLPDAGELTTPLPADDALDAVEEELRVRRYRVVRREGDALGREGPPQGDRQPAVPPVAGGAAARPGRRQALGLRGQHPGHRGPGLLQLLPAVRHLLLRRRWWTAGTSPRCASTSRTSAPSTSRTSPRRRSRPTSATARRARRAGPPTIGINDPLRVDGERIYLTGHGFSPTFSVTRPDGTAITDVSVPFLPADQNTMASEGALKLPDLGAESDDQLALQGFFAPTGVVQAGVLTSVDPRPLAPQVAVVVYEGYLGLDSGIPQSVYSLDAAPDRPRPADRGRCRRTCRSGSR